MLLPPRVSPEDRVVRLSPGPGALAELNAALRARAVRAIVAGDDVGAYLIAEDADAEAARRDPKPIVGIGDVTYLHLTLWRKCGLVGVHGPALPPPERVRLVPRPDDLTAAVTVGGRATGFLMGGNLSALRGLVGVGLPSLDGAILLLEDTRRIGLGQVDRQLTQLLRSGALDGVRGVALGRFTGFDDLVDRGWTLVEVLQERLSQLGVPVLGGLPLGRGPDAVAVPLGPQATLDTDAGTLTIAPDVD